ncbi:MAG: biotin/lipoyl-binding protein [Ruminococcaceae bacterium]|nr:biotin/lipoyl-binding protein [Oscillospiraceae bacterium]
MKYIVNLNGKKYEVEVEEGSATLLSVSDAPAAVAPAAPVPSAPAAAPVAPVNVGSGTPVLAPLTGSVLNIAVSNGAKVKAGDLLLIIEAMKMENEIVAPVDGTVTQIAVTKGAQVNTDDLLVVIG